MFSFSNHELNRKHDPSCDQAKSAKRGDWSDYPGKLRYSKQLFTGKKIQGAGEKNNSETKQEQCFSKWDFPCTLPIMDALNKIASE